MRALACPLRGHGASLPWFVFSTLYLHRGYETAIRPNFFGVRRFPRPDRLPTALDTGRRTSRRRCMVIMVGLVGPRFGPCLQVRERSANRLIDLTVSRFRPLPA